LYPPGSPVVGHPVTAVGPTAKRKNQDDHHELVSVETDTQYVVVIVLKKYKM
jgi:hypothetical protein